jgi:O-antigen ligase
LTSVIIGILTFVWIIIITSTLLWTAFKYPSILVILYIAVNALPYLFQMTPIYDLGKWSLLIGFGIRASDYLLIVMLIAIFIKIFFYKEKPIKIKGDYLVIFAAIFAGYLFFEILRNIVEYKISAFGEFRYTYITLILPVYIVCFFSSEEERIKLFRFSVFASLVITLAFIPIIGYLKLWDIHPIIAPEEGRFLPSELSLGLFYGILGLIFGKKYGIFELSKYLIFIITLLSFSIILIDGHRSVWLSIIVVFAFLFMLRSNKLKISFRLSLPAFLIVLAFSFFVSNYFDLTNFLSERLTAFTNPQQDPTANWRLINWSFQLQKFFNSPIIGEGFGGYWGSNIYSNDIWVMPHNLYIMILAKLGLIGLILYLGVNVRIFLDLKNSLAKGKLIEKQIAIVILGVISIVGANVYAAAYYVDPRYSWLFVGLGLAAVLNKKENEA